MCLGDSVGSGCLGGSIGGGISGGFDTIIELHGVEVTVTRHDLTAERDIYLRPLDEPEPFTATVVVTKLELQEKPIVAGGRRHEELHMLATAGTLLENDIVAYGGHNYDIRNVKQAVVGDTVVNEEYVALREVDA